MEKLNSFEREIYNDAKFFRIFGVLLLAIALISVVFLFRTADLKWGILTTMATVFFSVSVVLVSIGDRNIRKLKKHTGVHLPPI